MPSISGRTPAARSCTIPTFKSCTLFICTVAKERWTYEAPDLRRARTTGPISSTGHSITDAEDSRGAGRAGHEAHPGDRGRPRARTSCSTIIRWMRTSRWTTSSPSRRFRRSIGPLYERHLRSIDMIREQGFAARTASCSSTWSGYDLEGYNKFIPYYLLPDCIYTVSVSPSSFRTKISVGSNPWVTGPEAQSGDHLRAVRRRRTRSGRRHQLRYRSHRRGAQSSPGDRRGASDLDRSAAPNPRRVWPRVWSRCSCPRAS